MSDEPRNPTPEDWLGRVALMAGDERPTRVVVSLGDALSAVAAGRAAERDRIVKTLEADYRANVADGADGVYTDGLHDAWRLTERQSKRDDLIKPEDTE